MRPAISRSTLLVFLITQFAFFAFAQTPSETAGPPPTPLELGKPIEREFRLGETHVYEIPLEVNQYLKVSIAQRSIDVSVTLYDPVKKKVVDSDYRRTGPEQAYLISAARGIHLVEIGSNRRCDPGDKGGCIGKYEVKIAELRNATLDDERRIEAQRLYKKLHPATNAWEEPSSARLTRIVGLKELSALAKSLKELQLAANCEEDIAHAYGFEIETGNQIKHLENARSLWLASDETSEEIRTLRNLSLYYSRNGEVQKGLDAIEMALTLSRESGDKSAEEELRYTLAGRYVSLNPRRAVAQYTELLRIARTMKYDSFGALRGMARAHERLGEHEKAKERLREAIADTLAAGYKTDDTVLYFGLAELYGDLGEHEKAAENYEKEYQLVQDQKPFNHMAPLANAGRAYFRAGNYAKALDFSGRALLICRNVGHRLLLAAFLVQVGDIYLSSGNPQKALEHYEEEAVLRKTGNSLSNEARSLYNRSRAHRDLGDYSAALAAAQRLIDTLESQRADILSSELRAALFSSSHLYYEYYIDLLMQMDKRNPSDRYSAQAMNISERAKARSLLETLAVSRSEVLKGITPDLMQQARSSRRRLSSAADEETRVLTAKSDDARKAAAAKAVDDATDEYNRIQNEIKRASPSYAALTIPIPLTTDEIQNDLLDSDTVVLEFAVGNETSYLWLVTTDKLNSYKLPRRLEVETAARRVYELLQNGKRWTQDGKINAEYAEAAGKLSEMVLGPVAEHIKGKRLVIVADGALQYIPFSALPRPKGIQTADQKGTTFEPMAVGNEIVSLPSASTLAVLRREAANRKRAGNGVAIVADPVFSDTDERLANARVPLPKSSAPANPDLSRMLLERAFGFNGESSETFSIPRLPFTRREADSIFANAPKASSFKALDFAASRDAVMGRDLSQYRIVHFATHGVLHSEHPELSGIVLSLVNEKGEPVNGFLRLNEIYNMNLNADLVVLSACQTALGKEVRGEGLIGLTRGFMYAGSPRVVASLWKVDDVATAELMKIFYQKMLKEKMRPAAALRAAKIAMMKQKRWNAPYYWAAFELQGEWR